ncbi:MAG TPA: BrnA antitoxin family protein [Longimicrobium sp.]|nr:BrnA antitoxin family protein [Longimicrobium sp.]
MKDEYDFSKGRRGPVDPSAAGKIRITIRIDADVLDWFREQVNVAGGGNYQTMINNALRDHVARNAEQLEDTIRRVVRDELRNVPPSGVPAEPRPALATT